MMLNSILQYCQPDNWQSTAYDKTRYKLFPLQPGYAEYQKEINAFVNDGMNVNSLQRIQNPYLLGYFKLRQGQKEFRNEHVDVVKFYHPIHKNDMGIALEYNMDVRRYTNKYSGQHYDNKNPIFYKSPGRASNVLAGLSNSDKAIIICDVLEKSCYSNITTYKVNQSEYMPTYVATWN